MSRHILVHGQCLVPALIYCKFFLFAAQLIWDRPFGGNVVPCVNWSNYTWGTMSWKLVTMNLWKLKDQWWVIFIIIWFYPCHYSYLFFYYTQKTSISAKLICKRKLLLFLYKLNIYIYIIYRVLSPCNLFINRTSPRQGLVTTALGVLSKARVHFNTVTCFLHIMDSEVPTKTPGANAYVLTTVWGYFSSCDPYYMIEVTVKELKRMVFKLKSDFYKRV